MAYGYEDEVAMEASQLYSDVSDAIEYIQHNLKDAEKKLHTKDFDQLISSKYKTVDFEIFVAIDFGTHGTGLGYAIKKKKEQIDSFDDEEEYEYITFMEQDWAGGNDSIKNKTDILLSHNGRFIAFGYDALNKLSCVVLFLCRSDLFEYGVLYWYFTDTKGMKMKIVTVRMKTMMIIKEMIRKMNVICYLNRLKCHCIKKEVMEKEGIYEK